MKKRYVVGMLLLASLLLLIGYNRYFYTFRSLDHATLFLGPINSPDGTSQANAYYLNYGGAAGGVLYLVEVEHVETGEKKLIYSSNAKEAFALTWKSSDTLAIRNESPKYGEFRSVDLHVMTDIYEESGAACRSLVLRGKFKNCYKAEDLQVPLIFRLMGF
jgi:hypothetical protein